LSQVTFPFADQSNELREPSKKLLRTLQWIFVNLDQEFSTGESHKSRYQISYENIELFVYLFAPVLYKVKESDLEDPRLQR